MKTLIRYAGGKTKAIKKITPYVSDYEKIVSPFLGGGSLEVHWASLGKEVMAFDIFDALVNFWSVLLSRPDELSKCMSDIIPNEVEYDRVKEELIKWDKTQEMLKDWKTKFYQRENPVQLDEVTAAAYYFFNHNTSYGPGFLGWPSSVYLNQKKWSKMIQGVKSFKLPNLKVEKKSFDEVISQNTDEFLYLDPPYYLDKDSDNKMFKGIYPMRNIPIHHDKFEHELLRDLLHNHKGDFVLSYNNCETIRNYYKDFEQVFPKWNYSMGNGEKRIGKNRKNSNISNSKDSHEILIIKRTI